MENMIEQNSGNELTSFMIGGEWYKVIATKHGLKQMNDRELDAYHIASACLALGKKLAYYNNSGKHVMIADESKNLSAIITVENNTIVLITVINKGRDLFAKSGTMIENFSFA